jgi:hypothetical protein
LALYELFRALKASRTFIIGVEKFVEEPDVKCIKETVVIQPNDQWIASTGILLWVNRREGQKKRETRWESRLTKT